MSDILKDLEASMGVLMEKFGDSNFDTPTYILLARAVGEIERLRKANSDMGWQLNPDRMGGQFTEEEINRGNEWR